MFKKLPLIVAAGALAIAVAVPASAPAASNCKSHKVAYIAHGKYVSSSLHPALAPGTWSGLVTIRLTSANRHFKKAENVTIKNKGTAVLYTFTVTNAKVSFSSVVKNQGLKGGDRVTVTGTLVVRSGTGCLSPFAKTVVIKHVFVSSKTGK